MRWYQRSLLLLCLAGFLSGCSNIDLSDVATTAGASAGAVGAAVLTTNPAGILVGTVAGGAAGAALVEDSTDPVDACIENPEVCETVSFWHAVEDFVHWIIGGGVLLIITAWLLPGPQALWRRRDDNANNSSRRTRQGRFGRR